MKKYESLSLRKMQLKFWNMQTSKKITYTKTSFARIAPNLSLLPNPTPTHTYIPYFFRILEHSWSVTSSQFCASFVGSTFDENKTYCECWEMQISFYIGPKSTWPFLEKLVFFTWKCLKNQFVWKEPSDTTCEVSQNSAPIHTQLVVIRFGHYNPFYGVPGNDLGIKCVSMFRSCVCHSQKFT